MTKGHSNVCNLETMHPYPTNPNRWCIPIEGGSSVYTVKNLPDLALSKNEWFEIGKKAGWISQ
ncbi:MAG: hypothetical protein WC365_08350 [Candidatus Babeliales bacterium]|jgi:hypothetical protein